MTDIRLASTPPAPALPPVPVTAFIRELVLDETADEHAGRLITLIRRRQPANQQGALQ
jgi:hypothetical protein